MARKNINIRVGFDMKNFSTSQQKLVRGLKKTSKKMANVGKTMTTYVTAPIVALGAVSVKTFAEFEQSMAKVKAISGATGKEFEGLTKLAKDLGISTRYTASQVAELQLNYSKLGFSSDEIQKITESTLQLALATGEDLAQSAEVAGSTLRGFGLEAGEMQRVVDVMAKSFSSSALNLERFSTAMAVLAPVAKGAGVTLEEATGYLSILVDRGVDASTAGTGLRNLFLDLAGSGMTLNEALSKIQNSTNKNATAFQMFGKRGATVASIMAENIGEATKLSEVYLKSAGSAKEMAAIMDNTLNGAMLRLKSAFEGASISIGEQLAPYVSKLADLAAGLALKFNKLDDNTKSIILTIAGLVAAIGPLLIGVAALTAALAFLAANPVVLMITGIIVAIGTLVAAIWYVKNNFQAFADFFYNLWVKVANNFIGIIQKIAKGYFYIVDLFGLDIGNTLSDYLEGLKLTSRESTEEFETFGETVDRVKHKVKAILPPTKELKEGIKGVGDEAAKAAEKINVLTKLIKNPKNLKLPKVKIGFGESLGKSEIDDKAFTTKLEIMGRAAVARAKKIGQDISEALTNGLQNLAIDSAVIMGEFLGAFATGDAGIKDFGSNILNAIGSFMQQFGQAMIAIGIAQAGINAAIASMNPVLAIAGGVALVAAGAALSNVASRGIQGAESGGGMSIAPSYSGSPFSDGMNTSSRIIMKGREMIIVTDREKEFRR